MKLYHLVEKKLTTTVNLRFLNKYQKSIGFCRIKTHNKTVMVTNQSILFLEWTPSFKTNSKQSRSYQVQSKQKSLCLHLAKHSFLKE